MTARKAVGDSGRGQWVIKTLYELGYRFVAAVEECIEHTAEGTGVVADAEPRGARSQAQAPDGHMTLAGGVAERRGHEWTEEDGWEPKLVAVLAIDVAWPQAIDRSTPREVPWTTVRRCYDFRCQGLGATL